MYDNCNYKHVVLSVNTFIQLFTTILYISQHQGFAG